jgi:hypothetical protein
MSLAVSIKEVFQHPIFKGPTTAEEQTQIVKICGVVSSIFGAALFCARPSEVTAFICGGTLVGAGFSYAAALTAEGKL